LRLTVEDFVSKKVRLPSVCFQAHVGNGNDRRFIRLQFVFSAVMKHPATTYFRTEENDESDIMLKLSRGLIVMRAVLAGIVTLAVLYMADHELADGRYTQATFKVVRQILHSFGF
jgi:hypothetical protein